MRVDAEPGPAPRAEFIVRFFKFACSGLSLLFICFALFSSCGSRRDDEDLAYSARRNVGDSAQALLASDRFKKLIVEIQFVEGFQPSQAALDKLKIFLEARLNKPSGIQIAVGAPIAASGKTSFTVEEVRAIEDENRLYYSSGDQLAAYFLFLDGGSASDSGSFKILGQAHRNTSMVLYEKSIQDLSGALTQPPTSTVEATVLLHEFGHILGLVNVGSPLQTAHQDTSRGAHCSNPNCLMYYSVDSSDVLGNLLGGNIPALDDSCELDLQANGGK